MKFRPFSDRFIQRLQLLFIVLFAIQTVDARYGAAWKFWFALVPLMLVICGYSTLAERKGEWGIRAQEFGSKGIECFVRF